MISSQKTLKSDFNPTVVNGERRDTKNSYPRIFNDDGEEVFMAGQWVIAGTYRQVDSSRIVTLEMPGVLPPSFDGRRAEYCRVERPWVTLNTGLR
jgi:hypothetical protein